jgi:ATP-binding cassette subfamily B (MDR/TAP) protein 1
MIERFYDPLIGRVTLDGIDIKDLNVGSYRSNVSLVSQEPTLYAGTVRFNVKLGASKPMDQVTEEEVVQACKDANIVCLLPPSSASSPTRILVLMISTIS